MKRPALAVAVVALVALLTRPAGAADAPPVPDIFQGKAIAGGEHDSIAVPAYFETFLPYSLAEASNDSAHSYNAVLYLGFFLTAAAEQFGFPPNPGTTETLYPQGPVEAAAEAVPNDIAAFGESSGKSGPSGASGTVTAGGGVLPGLGRIGFGEATTSVAAEAKKVTSTGRVVMNDITIAGVLHIGSIVGEATAIATGAAGGASTTGQVDFTDATVLGVPLDILGTALPGLPGLDAVLAQAGVSITRLPDVRTVSPDGTRARLQLGGLNVTIVRPERDVTITLTFGRLDVAAHAETIPPLPARTRIGGQTEEYYDELSSGSDTQAALAPFISPSPSGFASGSVKRVAVPAGADYSTLSALIAIAALAALFSRRIMHALVD